MIIKSLELSGFRNYDLLDMEFDAGTNILYGNNAQGKTNILEAIFMCATTKSHRGSKDNDIIKFDSDEAHLRVVLEKEGVDTRIDMHLRRGKAKGAAIDQTRVKRAADLMGVLNVVFFSPEDLSIIKNGPVERRRFIDMELCQLDPMYLNHLNQFNKIINQRNKLLKDMYYDPNLGSTLDIWDMQLCTYGKEIIARRIRFIDDLNKIITGIHSNLSGGKEELRIVYEPNVSAENLEQKMAEARERDIRLKQTTVGPHRDDIGFYSNEIDIRKFGSQGQQRTAALSLKLSEIELVKQITGDVPVLLLDDVLSELDRNRQNYLLSSICDIQTIITCTGLDDFVNNRFEINRMFHISEGRILV